MWCFLLWWGYLYMLQYLLVCAFISGRLPSSIGYQRLVWLCRGAGCHVWEVLPFAELERGWWLCWLYNLEVGQMLMDAMVNLALQLDRWLWVLLWEHSLSVWHGIDGVTWVESLAVGHWQGIFCVLVKLRYLMSLFDFLLGYFSESPLQVSTLIMLTSQEICWHQA